MCIWYKYIYIYITSINSNLILIHDNSIKVNKDFFLDGGGWVRGCRHCLPSRVCKPAM